MVRVCNNAFVFAYLAVHNLGLRVSVQSQNFRYSVSFQVVVVMTRLRCVRIIVQFTVVVFNESLFYYSVSE